MGNLRRILLYATVGPATYLFMRKFFPESIEPESNSELDVDVRGGDLRKRVSNNILDLILKDREVKIAIVATFTTIIASEFNEQIVGILLKSSPAILANPANKLRLSSKVKKILGTTNLIEVKEILLNKTLTNKDKLILLRLKLIGILKGLKGRKRVYFLLSLISLLIFMFGNNTPVFAFFWANLRELFKKVDLDEYVIELYQEFNATIPEELINQITE